MPTVLNAGSGASRLREYFGERWADWQELRVDLDPEVAPDLLADLRGLPLEDASVEAVVCLGVLEHFTEREVPVVLAEFARVLCPRGELVILVPDLVALGRELAAGRLTDVLYESAGGAIRTLDVLYGLAEMSDDGRWAHRTGFSGETLTAALGTAGFTGVVRALEAECMLLGEARSSG